MTNSPPSRAVITVEDLTKRFRGVTAVDGLTFGVRAGAVTGFFGPNGAGKTTALTAIVGLARPTAGQVLINGVPVGALAPDAGKLGVYIGLCGAHPGRTARAHLRSLAVLAGLPRHRADDVLATVGLDQAAGRRVGTFSLGMRQRLGLASALLGDPEILVLDEPVNGLDPQGIRWLRTLLRDRAAAGGTILLSSHVLAEAEQTVDDVVMIHRGRLVHTGSIRDLARMDGGGVLVSTPTPDRLAPAVRRAGGRAELRTGDNRIVVTGLDARRVAELALGENVVVDGISPRTMSLEDLFFARTEGVDA